jgi:hypothetical protein
MKEIITIIIVILIMSSGTGILSSLVFAQTDFGDLTVTDSSENLVNTPGLELPQQQGPIPPATAEQPSEEPTIR